MEDIVIIDWPNIISRGFESKDLDYKGPIEWIESNKKECCEIIKDILAIANLGGGWIIIGVSETSTGFSEDGVSDKQAKSFETTRLNNFLNNYSDPPINTHLHKPLYKDKRFVVIEIPGFPGTPYICKKQFPDVLSSPTLYIRTDNNESAPLKSSFDFQKIIERAIRNRSDQLLSSFRTILTGGKENTQQSVIERYEKQIEITSKRCEENNPHKDKPYAYRETSFFLSRFEEDRFDLSKLKSMAENAAVDFRGWPFIFFSKNVGATNAVNDGIETLHTKQHPFSGGDTFHYWKLYTSGLMYTKEILWEDTRASAIGSAYYINYIGLSLLACETVHCLIKLYENMVDDSEEVSLRFRLEGIQDRFLLSDNIEYYIAENTYQSRDDKITYKAVRPLVEWRAGLIDHALEICKYTFQRFNWDSTDLSFSKKLMEEMLQRKLYR